jgi:hypothetical protein
VAASKFAAMEREKAAARETAPLRKGSRRGDVTTAGEKGRTGEILGKRFGIGGTAARAALADASRVDEVKELADKAVAIRAYYSQSRDINNEVAAMRIRVRAERRMGELIEREQEAGRIASPNGDVNQHRRVSSVSTPSTLSELGIPRDRSARAQELARVHRRILRRAARCKGRPIGLVCIQIAWSRRRPLRRHSGPIGVLTLDLPFDGFDRRVTDVHGRKQAACQT